MPDLLSSILTGQNLLFAPSSQVTIQRGGGLVLNEQPKPPSKPKLPKERNISKTPPPARKVEPVPPPHVSGNNQ